jgi:hypothetical protein
VFSDILLSNPKNGKQKWSTKMTIWLMPVWQLDGNIRKSWVGFFWGFINIGNGTAKNGPPPPADIAVALPMVICNI